MNQYRNLPRSVYILCLGILITNLGSFVFPLMTFIGRDYGFSVKEISWIISSFVIFSIMGNLFGGKISDEYGRRNIVALSMIMAGIMFLLIPYTSKTGFLILVALATMFLGMSRPGLDAMIADVTTQDQRKAALGLRYIAINVGFSFGPALGAVLYNYNINYLFIGDALTTILFALVIFVFISETKKTQEEMAKHIESGEEINDEGLWKVLFSSVNLQFVMLFSFLVIFTFTQGNYGISLYTQSLFNMKTAAIIFSICMTVNGTVVAILTPIITKMTKNLEASNGMMIGALLIGLGYMSYGFVQIAMHLYICTVIWSIGEVFWAINGDAFLYANTPINYRGSVVAIKNVIGRGSKILSLAFAGFIVEKISFYQFWILFGSFALTGSLLAWAVSHHKYHEIVEVRENR